MGVRSETENEALTFIQAADAEPWARFLQTKLHCEKYNIPVQLHAPAQDHVPDLFHTSKTCAVLVSPGLLEEEHRQFWTRCIDRFHARTIVLFLGADTNDMKQSLGQPLTERVLRRHYLEVDGTQSSVSEALIRLIEVYESSECCRLDSLPEDGSQADGEGEEGQEGSHSQLFSDDKDIYDYPPPPRQQNRILRVIPSVLYEEGSREVLVMMERQPDTADTVTLVTEAGANPPVHVVLKPIASCAYLALIPELLVGHVNFRVMCGDQDMGCGSLLIHSRLEQLRAALDKQTHPLTLLSQALGVSKVEGRGSEVEQLDAELARRVAITQVPPALKHILTSEDQVAMAENPDQENVRWPTLLHFAADFNLSRVCEELLRYSGMIHAACTENCDGLFPCQLAEKKGFRALQRQLVQYVEDARLRRSAADSGISFSELPPPTRHNSSGPDYVNDRISAGLQKEDDDNVYVDMSSQKFHGYAKPRSMSEGCVKTPYARTPSEARIEEEEQVKEGSPPPLQPKVGRSNSTCSAASQGDDDAIYVTPADLAHLEDLDTVHEHLPVIRPAGVNFARRFSESAVASCGPPLNELLGQEGRPTSQASTASSQSDLEQSASSPGFAADQEKPVMRGKESKRSKSVQDKISHFFKKIKKPSRKHSSDSDLLTKTHKKSIVYSRQSTVSTSSDPSNYSSSTMRCSGLSANMESFHERDSGAVCDDLGSPVLLRSKRKGKSTPRNSGKRNAASLQRRQSVRVLRAKNEDLSETPTLPARAIDADHKGTFVSFIK